MLKQWRNFKIICVLLIGLFFLNPMSYGETLYPNKTNLLAQQIDLLKTRLTQAQAELQALQKQQDPSVFTADHVNKQLLDETGLNIAVAKSNWESVTIELTESQQDVSRLEKDVQEIQNQLNLFNVFGLKVARSGAPNQDHLRQELDHEAALLQLEKIRVSYLLKLQNYADSMLQLYKTRYGRIESILKSQTILLLKERQAQTELDFEKQQSLWLEQLNHLKLQLTRAQENKSLDKTSFDKLQNEIFYVNESVNLTYLQMLIARYQDQLQQLRVSVARGNSITLFNKAADQAQLLGKQLLRLDALLTERIAILEKRKQYFLQHSTDKTQVEFVDLDTEYKTATDKVANLNKNLAAFRTMLDRELQHELSARQGLPGFEMKPWLEMGGELLLVPSLAFQVFKSLTYNVLRGIQSISVWGWMLFLVLQTSWIAAFAFLNTFLRRIVAQTPDHESGHINLKWLSIKLLHRNLLDIALIGNFIWLFSFLGVPPQNFAILINLALVWLCFKAIIMIARLCLVETANDRAGHDVRLYHQLKWIFLAGGIITALTVLMHELPVIYEIKDLFIRMFLLFLFVASIYLLKQWRLVPGLILPHIDSRRTYLKRVVVLLGLLIPVVLLVNSIVGLFGFVNLILTISWYEGIFIFVLVGYLLLRGLLIDGMEWISKILIRHVTNGWLWTEAFLKPLDKCYASFCFSQHGRCYFYFMDGIENPPLSNASIKCCIII